MNAAREVSHFVDEEIGVLKTLLYFDIFSYPLTSKEIVKYTLGITDFSVEECLHNLIAQKIIFQFHNFYSLRDDASLSARRIKGNALAEKRMKTARRFSRLIASFPFVRAVMLSGSISKGYMDEKSDIDYFIITETNRLWLVRTSLAFFRRIFLFNSGKNLCTNYFIDKENLEIREKNLFTAIELGTVKPMFGDQVVKDFLASNEWTDSFLPKFQFEENGEISNRFFLKDKFEKIASSKLIDDFNRWLMKKTISYWKRRYCHEMNPLDFGIAFRSTVGISKSHPQFFQKKVLSRYDQKVEEFKMQNGIDLS